MGYTHYWYRDVGSQIAPDVWKKICADARRLVANAPCKLVWDDDSPRRPKVDNEVIRFNGCGSMGHETFLFRRIAPEQAGWRATEPDVFDFCKTARKPYDYVVCGVLSIIAEHDPSVRVNSDGDPSDWQPALDWTSKTLDRPVRFPCAVEREDAK